ncbi:MAG: IclR family transcriptional regulator [Ahrensia sp.]|nr:IclR family transcriptional regulator [Ahrensia sp.]|tara:strand:- start:5164 stop:5988 length:825 start_codon:yes stop_codon:yes gene_type:complete
MSSALEKSLAILELLAESPEGLQVSAIASTLEIPVSGVHRQLQELARLGYVRQERNHGSYILTIKLAAMGLGFLGRSGVTDIAQPILDRLAAQTEELIRLSVLDGGDLIWVAVAQGATGGLRYDPGREQGVVVHLATSAGGQALLAAMTDEEALTYVSKQGMKPTAFVPGSGAPRTIKELLEELAETRRRGYSVSVNSYLEGMAAMAVPVRYGPQHTVIGCLSVAGPSVRMNAAKIAEFAPILSEAAGELGAAAHASQYFHSLHHEPKGASGDP